MGAWRSIGDHSAFPLLEGTALNGIGNFDSLRGADGLLVDRAKVADFAEGKLACFWNIPARYAMTSSKPHGRDLSADRNRVRATRLRSRSRALWPKAVLTDGGSRPRGDARISRKQTFPRCPADEASSSCFFTASDHRGKTEIIQLACDVVINNQLTSS